MNRSPNQHQQSPSRRSAILWNILQPGDPYDIRKSMIARLPDHPSSFMGSSLQLVCLLQAAEIERLSEYLEDFKLRYRQVARVELDRHSYEIQIKQLTEKANQYLKFKAQNDKLRDYLSRQSAQLEDWQKKGQQSGQLASLQAKYEALLSELKLVRERNSDLQRGNERLYEEIRTWKQKYQDSQRNRIAELQRQKQKLELSFKSRLEIQIREVSARFDSDLRQLRGNYNLARQQLESKNHQIQTLILKKDNLTKQIIALQNQLKQKSKFQGDFYHKTHQIEQLNRKLQISIQKMHHIQVDYEGLQRQYRANEELIRSLQKQRDFYIQKTRQMQQQLSHATSRGVNKEDFERLQNQCAMMSTEIQRLQLLKDTKTNECAQLHSNVSELNSKMRVYDRDITEFRRKQKEYLERIHSLETEIQLKTEDTSRVRFFEQEIQKQNSTLRIKNQQIATLEQKLRFVDNSSQLNGLKINLTERDKAINNLNSQIKELKRLLEEPLKRVRVLEEKVISYESSMPKMSQQIQRLKTTLHAKQTEISILSTENHRLIQNYQSIKKELIIAQTQAQNIPHQRIEVQVRKRIEVYEHKTLNIERENRQLRLLQETLRKRIIDLEKDVREFRGSEQSYRRRVLEAENQIIRLSQSLRERDEHMSDFEGQRLEMNRLVQDNILLTERAMALQNQLRSRPDSQNRIRALNQEIDRLNTNIRVRIQQTTSLQQRLALAASGNSAQIGSLRKALTEKEQAYHSLERELNEMEHRIHDYEGKQQSLNLKIRDWQLQLQNWKRQIGKRQDKIKEVQKENIKLKQSLDRAIGDLNSKIGQLQRIGNEYHKLRSSYQFLNSELSSLRRESVSQERVQIEVKRRVEIYERRITEVTEILNQERENHSSMHLKFKDQEEKIRRLAHQNEGLKRQLNQFQSQIHNLRNSSSQQATIWQQRKKEFVREYEQRINRMSEQLERLTVLLQSKDNHIRSLEGRVHQLSTLDSLLHTKDEHIRNLEHRIHQLQSQRQNNAKIQELSITIQNFRSQITQRDRNLQSLRQQLGQRDHSVENLRNQLNEKDRQLNSHKETVTSHHSLIEKYQKCTIEITNMRNVINELQEINNHTIAQRDQLFKLAHQLQEKLQTAQHQQVNTQSYDQQIKRLREELGRAQQQCRELSNTVNELRRAQQIYNVKLKEYEKKTKDIEKQMLTEIDIKVKQLTSQRNQYHFQIESLRRQLSQLRSESEGASELKKLNQELNKIAHQLQERLRSVDSRHQESLRSLKAQIDRLNIILREKVEELDHQKEHCNRMTATIAEKDRVIRQYENKLALTTQEIQRLSEIASNRQRLSGAQLESLENQLKAAHQASRTWEERYASLYKTYKEMENAHGRMLTEHERTKLVLQQYHGKLQMIQGQFDNLNRIIHQLKAENAKLRQAGTANTSGLQQKNRQLSHEIDRLNGIVIQLKKQIQECRLKLTDQFALQKRVQEQLALMVVLFAEIETLRRRVKDTELQCENVRRSSLTPYRIDQTGQHRR